MELGTRSRAQEQALAQVAARSSALAWQGSAQFQKLAQECTANTTHPGFRKCDPQCSRRALANQNHRICPTASGKLQDLWKGLELAVLWLGLETAPLWVEMASLWSEMASRWLEMASLSLEMAWVA